MYSQATNASIKYQTVDDDPEVILFDSSKLLDYGCPSIKAMDAPALELLHSFHLRFVFPSVTNIAPRCKNAFDVLMEQSISVKELPTRKKNPINAFDRLYNDIHNHLLIRGLDWKRDKVSILGNKFITQLSHT